MRCQYLGNGVKEDRNRFLLWESQGCHNLEVYITLIDTYKSILLPIMQVIWVILTSIDDKTRGVPFFKGLFLSTWATLFQFSTIKGKSLFSSLKLLLMYFLLMAHLRFMSKLTHYSVYDFWLLQYLYLLFQWVGF